MSAACGAESQWMVPLTFLPSAGLPFPVSRSAVQCSSAIAAVCAMHDLVALHDISAHQANLSAFLHAEELGRRDFGKVARVDIKLAGKGHFARSRVLVLRVIGQVEILGLVGGVVGNHHTQAAFQSRCGGARCGSARRAGKPPVGGCRQATLPLTHPCG